MFRGIGGGLAALALLAATPGHATEICGWLVETVGADDFHEFALWLQSDSEADIYYMMKGEGLTSEGMRNYSPGSGSFVLHARKAVKPWGFGGTLPTPGDIDIIAEVHAPPASIFHDEDAPLLATFTFKRHVPEDETAPPKDFAKKQCATVTLPPRKDP